MKIIRKTAFLLFPVCVLMVHSTCAIASVKESIDTGNAYAKSGNMREAISEFDKAIAEDPKNVEAYSRRGKAYWKLKQYDKAIADCNKVIEIDPNLKDAFSVRGISKTRAGDFDGAIADFDRAIQIDPLDDNVWFNRASAYEERGNKLIISDYAKNTIDFSKATPDYAKAIANYDKAIEINPKIADYFFFRGNVYWKMEQINRAIEDYSKAIEADPKFEMAYEARGKAYSELSNEDRALLDFKKAIEIDPKNSFAYVCLGRTYKRKENLNLAIENFTKAFLMNPNDAGDVDYANRGWCFYKLGKYDEAINDYEKAIELNPKYALARQQASLAYYSRAKARKGAHDYAGAYADMTKAIENRPNEMNLGIIGWHLMRFSAWGMSTFKVTESDNIYKNPSRGKTLTNK